MAEDEKLDAKKDKEEEKKPAPFVEEEPVVTHHEIALRGRTLKYTVTTGRMPLRNELDEIEAQVFFMAYTKDDVVPGERRPLMFSFNGGPGSPSLWLHMGALGPKRLKSLDRAAMPKPPFDLVDNEQTWLEDTDLVFIDPVGTGFSRAHTKELGEKFWGVQGDIESVGEFIRLYITRYERWASPLYLVGESYGTTRSAGLAGHLIDRGIAFSGIVLVSSILNFQTARFGKGNDLPYVLFLPTYTATAWYHKRLPADLQKNLRRALDQVERFAVGEYSAGLAKGDRISAEERNSIIEKLSRFTGLSKPYLDSTDLRIHIWRFCKELLRDQKRTVGRIDSRFKGIDRDSSTDGPEHDPSMTALMAPYTAMFNHYVRTVLGYKTDINYEIFGGIKSPWNWGSAGEGHPDTSEALRAAMAKNPHMRIYIASGFFDLATPYFATEWTIAHMGIDPEVRGNISTGTYEAGHMMYVHGPSLAKLKADVAKFLKS
jgi:carboxypeptidase C (cathepsin A)